MVKPGRTSKASFKVKRELQTAGFEVVGGAGAGEAAIVTVLRLLDNLSRLSHEPLSVVMKSVLQKLGIQNRAETVAIAVTAPASKACAAHLH